MRKKEHKHVTGFWPNQRVRCIRGHHFENVLKQGKEYKIAVVVISGYDYHYTKPTERNLNMFGAGRYNDVGLYNDKPVCGLILFPYKNSFPFVWDSNRFELVKD